MRILIEITWENREINYPLIAFDGNHSHLRLCDGITDVTYSGKTWIAGYLAKNDNLTYKHYIDLESKSGGLEEISTFNVNLLNENMLEDLTLIGVSFLDASLKLQIIEQNFSETEPNFADFEQLYYCEITSLSLDNNILTITGSTPRKGLGPVGKNIAYGNIFSQEIKSTEEFDTEYVNFQNIDKEGQIHISPNLNIYRIDGLTCPNDRFYGVYRQYNPNFEYVYVRAELVENETEYPVPWRFNNYTLKFGPSFSNDNKDVERKVVNFEVLNGFPKLYRFTIDQKLPSNQVAHFDCVKIKVVKKYYELPTDITPENIDIKYKVGEDFQYIPKNSYEIETINEKNYAVLYPFKDAYKKIEIDNIKISEVKEYESWMNGNAIFSQGVTTCAGTLENILTSNLEEFYAFEHTIFPNETVYSSYFRIELESEELRTVDTDDVYLSILMDKPTRSQEQYYRYFYEYDNGDKWPCDNDAIQKEFEDYMYETPFPLFATKGMIVNDFGLYGLPYPNIRTQIFPEPTITNLSANASWLNSNLSASQVSAYNSKDATYFNRFDEPDIVKIECGKDKFPRLNKLFFEVVSFYVPGYYVNPFEKFPTIINHLGLYKKESFDPNDFDTLYIDIVGKFPDSPNFINGANDFVGDLLTSAGYSNSTILDIIDYPFRSQNHKWVNNNETIQDLVETLSEQGLFVTSFDKDNKNIKCAITTFSTFLPEFQILQSDIYEILENITDSNQSNIITYPKFISKTKSNEDIYAELIDNTKDYLTGALIYSTGDFNSYSNKWDFGNILPIHLTSKLYNKSLENKNVINKSDITFDLIYPDSIPLSTNASTRMQYQILEYIDYKMTRKYKIKISVDWNFRNIYIGKRVLVNDSRIYNNANLIGNIAGIECDPISKTVNLEIVITEIISLEGQDDIIQDIGEGEFELLESDSWQDSGIDQIEVVENQGQ